MRMTNQIVVAFMLGEGIILGIIAYALFRKKSAKLALCIEPGVRS